ncbi:porin family protein [Fulvivirga kasyanovii]|uniref:PorT family protein n=1 Tax=Fulvivirga kasyanovii TaxID=396812 RepID=A0ABW9RQB5_9BACT|nr:porin family protein [Fulvivirga kasyanovii]MTI26080.1 PorT family protein [Fulvivirga kasyanovii]
MKRILLITALFCISAGLANAQIKIGIKEGLNVASIDYTTPLLDTETSALASFHLGAFFHYSLVEHFGLQAELMYSGQGAKIDFKDYGVLTKNKLNYLSLPLLAKYHASSGFTAEAGFSLDFLLSAKQSYEEIDAISGSGLQLTEQDLKDGLTGVDTKFLFGVGYEMASGLSFNARFAAGLSNISKSVDENDPNYIGEEESFNSVFQLGVGFPLYGN